MPGAERRGFEDPGTDWLYAMGGAMRCGVLGFGQWAESPHGDPVTVAGRPWPTPAGGPRRFLNLPDDFSRTDLRFTERARRRGPRVRPVMQRLRIGFVSTEERDGTQTASAGRRNPDRGQATGGSQVLETVPFADSSDRGTASLRFRGPEGPCSA